MSTNLNDKYLTTSSNTATVILKVTIGYAQKGTTSIALDNIQVITPDADANGNYPDTFSINLGVNNSLKGKQLFVSTNVLRIQPNVPDASVTITLNGGASGKSYPPLIDTITTNGDTLNFTATIDFI